MLSIYQSKDHRWRDAYNPLRGLSVPKLVSLLEAGERGQYADLQWFYHYMERSDALVYSVLQRRRAALLELDWDVREVSGPATGEDLPQAAQAGRRATELSRKKAQGAQREMDSGSRGRSPSRAKSGDGKAGVDRALAEEQAAFLREVYDGIENFREAVAFMFLAFFRGFSHLEKHWTGSGLIARLTWRQRCRPR